MDQPTKLHTADGTWTLTFDEAIVPLAGCAVISHNGTIPLKFHGTTPDGWDRWGFPTWTERLPRKTKKAVRKFFGHQLTRTETRRVFKALARLKA